MANQETVDKWALQGVLAATAVVAGVLGALYHMEMEQRELLQDECVQQGYGVVTEGRFQLRPSGQTTPVIIEPEIIETDDPRPQAKTILPNPY